MTNLKEIAPGRKLDALIAEKVMGHAKLADMVIHRLPAHHAYKDLNDPICFICGRHERDGTKDCLPNYSTLIAAAWEVVEKLKMTISAPTAPYASGEYANSSKFEWEAECTRVFPAPSDWSDSVFVRGESAPHAICLAALKAVGYDPKS